MPKTSNKARPETPPETGPETRDDFTRLWIGPHDQFWLVTDATRDSVLADVLLRTTLNRLAMMFRGGLSMDDHPTIYLDRADAIEEAGKRLAMAGVKLDALRGG